MGLFNRFKIKSLIKEASKLFCDANYFEALEVYNKILEMDSHKFPALVGKGFTLKNLGRYQEALENINEAFNLNPKKMIMKYYFMERVRF